MFVEKQRLLKKTLSFSSSYFSRLLFTFDVKVHDSNEIYSFTFLLLRFWLNVN